jgi:paired small multidrug resistance pump
MAWVFLILAGCFEVIGVLGMNRVKLSKSVLSYALLVVGFLLSFAFLSLAMKSIAMGTAYAVWTGIGTAGGALVGILFYGESKHWLRIVFIAIVLFAAVGLKLIS